MVRLAVLCAVLALGCGKNAETDKRAADGETETPTLAGDAAPPVPDGPQPTEAEAADVLRRFGRAVLAEDWAAARAELRIPPGAEDESIARDLALLVKDGHVSEAGIEAVIASGFGPIAERYGDDAALAAKNAGLELDRAFAFGDADATALLEWREGRFWVVAVLQLAELEASE